MAWRSSNLRSLTSPSNRPPERVSLKEKRPLERKRLAAFSAQVILLFEVPLSILDMRSLEANAGPVISERDRKERQVIMGALGGLALPAQALSLLLG